MDLENLPDIVIEKIVKFAVEKEYIDLYKNQPKEEYWDKRKEYFTGKWMEILYKFGQVCLKWENVIFGSKLFFAQESKTDSGIKIYMGKKGIQLQDTDYGCSERNYRLEMVQNGYMSFAKRMYLELGRSDSQLSELQLLFSNERLF